MVNFKLINTKYILFGIFVLSLFIIIYILKNNVVEGLDNKDLVLKLEMMYQGGGNEQPPGFKIEWESPYSSTTIGANIVSLQDLFSRIQANQYMKASKYIGFTSTGKSINNYYVIFGDTLPNDNFIIPVSDPAYKTAISPRMDTSGIISGYKCCEGENSITDTEHTYNGRGGCTWAIYLNPFYIFPTPPPSPPIQHSSTYTIPIGNWTDFVKGDVTSKESIPFIIGTSGGGKYDPAPGCTKQFSANYQCGNGPSKAIEILTGEAGGQTAIFDCSEENKICKGFKMTINDDGNVEITDSLGKKLWSSNTNKIGDALVKYSSINGKNSRNYLNAGETLLDKEFIGSPSGNCYLTMIKGVGLQIMYNEVSKCSKNVKFLSDPSQIGLFSIPRLPDSVTATLGKVGYISNFKFSEYDDSMVGYTNNSYSLIGKYKTDNGPSTLLDENSKFVSKSINDCKNKCSNYLDPNSIDPSGNPIPGYNSKVCSGISYNKKLQECSLLNNTMFPASNVRIYDNDYELYSRNKKISGNDISCPEVVETNSSLAVSKWEYLPTNEKMTTKTLCNLNKITKEDQNIMQANNLELYKLGEELQKKINNLSNKELEIIEKMGYNLQKLIKK
jgi:hypothetical protein